MLQSIDAARHPAGILFHWSASILSMNLPASTNTSQEACHSCQFFRSQEGIGGTCHRFPPKFAGNNAANELHRWKFPAVSPHFWCGEYRGGRPTPG
jgi:hypothetical protein